MDTEALIWWPYSSCALQGQSTTERASGGKMREKKSSVRWPHSDNKPGKSLSLEPFRNSTAVYTGGGWVEQDVQRACILQHLVMNTKHTQHVKSHSHTGIHKHSIPGPRCGMSCVWVVTLAASLRRPRPIYRSLVWIMPFTRSKKSCQTLLSPGYRPVSARLLERRPLVGSCVWLQGRLLQQHPLG